MGKLLFIASNRIGDAVLSTGALDHAMSLAPDAEVVIACGPLAAPLFRATPRLARLFEIEKVRTRGAHWMELWSALRGMRFDLAVDLRGTLITYALSARRRIVHRKSLQLRHKIDELTELMGASAPLRPRLHIDAAARAAAEAAFPAGGPALALGPGANFIGKRWPPERFAAVARRLTRPQGKLDGARIVIVGGPEDRQIGDEMVRSLDADGVAATNLAGALDLLAVAAVLERATLFIGNDSGLMHLAAAAGAPTLGLFGPSDERVYGPYGARTRALRGRAYADIMAIGPMPSINRSLMEELRVGPVEKAAIEMLHAGGLR